MSQAHREYADAYPLTAYQIAALDLAGRPVVQICADLTVVPAAEAGHDKTVLRAAIVDLVRRWPALRTWVDTGTLPGQFVAPQEEPVEIDSDDLSGVDTRVVAEVLGSRRARLRETPVGNGRRVTVHGLPDGAFAVTFDLAAPVVDPVGGAVLAEELLRCYAERSAGTTEHRGEAADGTRDAVAAMVAADGSRSWEQPLERVKASIVDSVATGTLSIAEAVVAEDVVTRLRSVAAALDLPLRTVMLAAHLWTTGQLAGRREAGTWVVADGRAAAGAGTGAVGEFRMAVPVAVDRDVTSWRELVQRAGAAWSASEPHLAFPVLTRVARGEMHGPAFEYRQACSPGRYIDRSPAPVAVVVTETGTRDELVVQVSRPAGGADGVLEHYLSVLELIAADVTRDPRLLPAGKPVDPVETVSTVESAVAHGLVFAHAESHPDAVAVIDGEITLTYGQLRHRALQLAGRLVRHGAGPGAVTGIYLPRSADLVVALLGVLAAGGAFLALDVDYPRQRSVQALADAKATVLITAEDLLEFTGPVVRADDHGEAIGRVDLPAVSPRASAYVLFTSGSTGRPKGVEVPHAALVNLMRTSVSRVDLNPADRVAQRTPVAFDAGVWELFAPLGCGATMVVLPSEVDKDTTAMETAMVTHAISVVQLVPTMLRMHVDAGTFGRCPELRLVLSGGEALSQELAAEFARQSTTALVNVYGPTECAVNASWWVAGPAASGRTVPIGRVGDGLRAYVLDELGTPAVACVQGELYLAGIQLAHGYRLAPGITAERFVPDPFAREPGTRMYRTGDRVVQLPGGELEFIGRTDRQVKIRGVRTEPGHVEVLLAAHPAIAVAAVRPGNDELIGYYTTIDGAEVHTGQLRTYLRERLAGQMVPSLLHALDRMPLLPNGKIDYAALPAARGQTVPEYRPPAGAVERQLAGLWAELLAVDVVGRNDDLTELGRDRLAAMRATARFQDITGVRVPPADMLGAHTVAGLAELIAVLTSQGVRSV